MTESSEALSTLPDESALLLARTWNTHRNPFSEQWKELITHKRPVLFELACFDDSLLGKEVESRFGVGSVIRGNHYNGCNLETSEGVQHAKKILHEYRPQHLWISCECGPYSPMQRLNRRTEEQCQQLEEKRAKARKQYQGGISVALEARKLGCEVHFELSERCEAWQLPEITDFIKKLQMQKVTCHGCTVGLRTKDGKKM